MLLFGSCCVRLDYKARCNVSDTTVICCVVNAVHVDVCSPFAMSAVFINALSSQSSVHIQRSKSIVSRKQPDCASFQLASCTLARCSMGCCWWHPRGQWSLMAMNFGSRCRRYERVCMSKIIQFGLGSYDEINLAGQVQLLPLLCISLHALDRVASRHLRSSNSIRRFMSILEIL